MGPARDLVGIGEDGRIRWPGGARVAVQFAINYEEGSEYTISTATDEPRRDSRKVPAVGCRGGRDLAFETMYEFGSRVGIWRLFRLFREREIPATVFGCALALKRNPAVAEALVEAGFDVCCHGWRWEEHFLLSEHEERERIARASPRSRKPREAGRSAGIAVWTQ